MSQKDMDDIKKAIAAIDARKKVTASFVRGGSPGLVQQKLKKYLNSASNIGIKKEIKETCKMHGEDLVLIEIGAYFKLIEEDAEYFHKEFLFKYSGTRCFLLSVNKKMKVLTRIFYDILLKVNESKSESFKTNNDTLKTYFDLPLIRK